MSILVSKKGGVKNLKILDELLRNRKENASLLGYANHATYKLKKRMAKNPINVKDFHASVYAPLKEYIKKDLNLIKMAKKNDVGTSRLEFGDLAYYTRRVMKEKFSLDPETTRKYFQLDRVLENMFQIAQSLFGITFKQKRWDLWHKDVRSYEVLKGGQIMGYVLMDLHPRKGKYTHAMASSIHSPGLNKWQGDTYITPSTAMVCNFRGPTKKVPSLLSFGEVTTLFHEFGHALHNTLTTAHFQSQAGYNTAWDFVELPSQIFEEWAWLPKVIKKMSSHVETGESMPKNMIENILRSRYFMDARMLGRQIALGAFDMSIHTKTPNKPLNTFFTTVCNTYVKNPSVPGSLFPASFGHIAGGYDAGYYSYLWSRVYAYDCFSRFQKEGVMSPKVGKQYMNEILAVGSSRDEMESLKKFLGRKPSTKAFIKHIISEIKKTYE